jgi:hypothetical protein
VEEADVAVSYGPGLRWGVMGQSLQWHLGGGPGGIKHFMEHLMDPLVGMMKSLGNPEVTAEVKQTIIEGVLREAGDRSVDQLAQEENKVLVGLLKLRTTNGRAAAAEKAPTTKSSAAVNGKSSERVFFLDMSGGHLESVNPDGSDRRVILDGLNRMPDGIDVDVEANLLDQHGKKSISE